MKNADQPIHPCLADGEDKGSFRLNKPGDDKAWTFASSPLTKREAFAIAAMQGLLANGYNGDHVQPLSTVSTSEIAKMAVNCADELLNELEK